MKGLYCFYDTRACLAGMPIAFDNDAMAREAMVGVFASGQIPSYLIEDTALYRIGDYDDCNGLPIVTGFAPILVMRGSDKYVQERIDQIRKASSEASE